MKTLRVHIDHVIPYSYILITENKNLVASCNICNQFKHNKHFEDEEGCFFYLLFKWIKTLKARKITLVK